MVSSNNIEDDNELDWDPNLELGYEIIDAEHRILHKLIVDFQEAVIQNAPKEKLTQILEDVIRYAGLHFANEEKVMAEYHYPKLDEHAILHKELLARVKDSCAQFQQDRLEVTHMYEFLLNWFAFHTSHQDKELVIYINNSSLRPLLTALHKNS